MDKKKLIAVYTVWLSRFTESPADFSESGTIEERAIRCADYFSEILAEIESVGA